MEDQYDDGVLTPVEWANTLMEVVSDPRAIPLHHPLLRHDTALRAQLDAAEAYIDGYDDRVRRQATRIAELEEALLEIMANAVGQDDGYFLDVARAALARKE